MWWLGSEARRELGGAVMWSRWPGSFLSTSILFRSASWLLISLIFLSFFLRVSLCSSFGSSSFHSWLQIEEGTMGEDSERLSRSKTATMAAARRKTSDGLGAARWCGGAEAMRRGKARTGHGETWCGIRAVL
ncbi:hypothetical protein M0R45_036218 [Rubus argutus]|uniref:Uncharacterized protein n=1 Tax=Rubus argutus TaxID=59490 RepID=A0AAW1VZ58_RUBAR